MAENDYDIGRCDDCGSEAGARRRVRWPFGPVLWLCDDCRTARLKGTAWA